MKNFKKRLEILYQLKRFATRRNAEDELQRIDRIIEHTAKLIKI